VRTDLACREIARTEPRRAFGCASRPGAQPRPSPRSGCWRPSAGHRTPPGSGWRQPRLRRHPAVPSWSTSTCARQGPVSMRRATSPGAGRAPRRENVHRAARPGAAGARGAGCARARRAGGGRVDRPAARRADSRARGCRQRADAGPGLAVRDDHTGAGCDDLPLPHHSGGLEARRAILRQGRGKALLLRRSSVAALPPLRRPCGLP